MHLSVKITGLEGSWWTYLLRNVYAIPGNGKTAIDVKFKQQGNPLCSVMKLPSLSFRLAEIGLVYAGGLMEEGSSLPGRASPVMSHRKISILVELFLALVQCTTPPASGIR